MNEWTVVFERTIRGLKLRRAVDVCADADLTPARLEELGREMLAFRERANYHLFKIRRVMPEGIEHTIVQGELF